MSDPGSWPARRRDQLAPEMFPEAAPGTGLALRYNRAKLAWYIIDPLFYDRNTNLVPPNVKPVNFQTNMSARCGKRKFSQQAALNGVPVNLAVLNLAFYPSERGPYNYDVSPTGLFQGYEC